jgi:hypothetical protein
MNCKPGDLAVIVRCDSNPECVGRIVQCLSFLGCARVDWIMQHDVWEVRWGDKDAREPGVLGWAVPDSDLRPIRDPGEDTTDESHSWLPPVPTTTKECA